MTDEWTLWLYCTDRDKHDPADVHHVTFRGPIEDLRPDHLSFGASNSMIELDCPSCPRTPRWRNADMIKLCQWAIGLMRTGQQRVELDVSKLNR